MYAKHPPYDPQTHRFANMQWFVRYADLKENANAHIEGF